MRDIKTKGAFNMYEENIEQLSLFEGENPEQTQNVDVSGANDELEKAVYTQMRKIHNEGLVVGFQTACHTALDNIYAFERKTGKKSVNDYKRCIKELKKFFEIGVSQKINFDEEITSEESLEVETVQN